MAEAAESATPEAASSGTTNPAQSHDSEGRPDVAAAAPPIVVMPAVPEMIPEMLQSEQVQNGIVGESQTNYSNVKGEKAQRDRAQAAEDMEALRDFLVGLQGKCTDSGDSGTDGGKAKGGVMLKDWVELALKIFHSEYDHPEEKEEITRQESIVLIYHIDK